MINESLLAKLHSAGILLGNRNGELAVSGNKGKLDAAFVGELRANKAALLEAAATAGDGWWSPPAIRPGMLPLVELTQAEIDGIVERVPGGARNVQDIYPLAPVQEGILFHHLLSEGGDAYLTSNLTRFDSRERLDAFLAALQAVIDRHDILRTAVAWEGVPEPVQVVWRTAPLRVEEVELDAAAGPVAKQLYARFDPRHFRIDVRTAPLLRGYVARDEAGGCWHLLMLLHHLADDNTSLKFIFAEIRAHLAGKGHLLPAALPFRNFVAQVRLGVTREEHEAFFREMLSDIDEPTAPFGLLDVMGDGTGIAEARLQVDAGVALRLRERARKLGVSTASLCHLAFAQVIGRASGRDDVVFGTVLFGRMQGGEGSDRVLGPFINTLPLRIRLGQTGVEASVREMQKVLAGLMRHEHASLALAQRCSGVRTPTPLFSALLNYRQSQASGGETRPAGEGQGAFDGMQAAHSEERTNYPVSMSVDDSGTRIVLTAQVTPSIGPERVCALMHTALEGLADALETAPGSPVGRIRVLPAAERLRVTEEWNATGVELPRDACMHTVFEEHAELTPHAVALVQGGTKLTYAELNARANRLAHHLRQLGVGPDARVGISVERGVEMMVGVLATLKAGGAYVPLDPAYPEDRLRHMLADSAPVVLLTQASLADRFAGVDAALVDLYSDAWDGLPDTNPERGGLTPDHLAYVIYTSGSTGLPKGVMVPHRGVVSLAVGQRALVPVDAGSRVLQFASLSFDATVYEMMLAFGSGASLHLAPRGVLLAGEALAEVVANDGITHFVGPVAVLATLPDDEQLSALRVMVLGGDVLPEAVARRWAAGRRLFNVYGPTEGTVWATVGEYGEDQTGKPSIGRPVSNTRIYILDEAGEPVPAGVPGEMFIGGVAVARGYLNRPELTAERFMDDPFAAGGRMYRTGDLARWLPDGEIEFLGRNDQQVKVRGFRIELGEIESRLGEHPDVRDAGVAALKGGSGDLRLVAYYVSAEPLQADELRAYLAEQLPDYMVPSAFVRLDALPLTPNLKLDRKALPAPDAEAYAAREFEAPVGELETVIAGAWAEVLGLDRVGRNDHFFEMGGHSLIAVRAVSRVQQLLKVEVTLGDLFARPVLAEFARGLDPAGRSGVPAIVPVERGERLALSFAQQRLWFLEQLGSTGTAYHIPTSLRLHGELDRRALGAALDRIVERHEALRTVFREVDGEPVQVVSAESRFLLVEHDLEGHPGAEAELRRLMAEEARARFDLAQGPLIRGRLIRMAADDHVLAVTMHHIVSDGWSMGVLTRELSALYGAFLRGEADPLSALPVQYADYAAWQRGRVDGEVLRKQADYWRATLGGAPELLEIPTDHARPLHQQHAGASVAVELDAELAAALKALGQRHGTTLFMTLMAGWAAVLGRLSGQDDVVIGTPTANRGQAEIQGLIGFFVNTLALRMDLSGAPTVAELLGRVKARATEAQDHQDIPFEQVVELVRPARSMSHSPLFQAMFSWQNNAQGKFELPGLKLASAGGAADTTAKFDLSLDLQEAAGGRIVGVITYATSLFERATIERYLGYLRAVLAGMAADERQAVGLLPILTAEERVQVVETWNRMDGEYHPAGLCIHEMFEAQVKRAPDALAVIFGDRTLTYGELNARANRLAHHLRGLGVGPDARVAICVERGVEMMVGLLAVLKAGGAYVPMDPAYPDERLRHMLDDSAPVVLLAPASLAGRFTGVPVLDLAGDAAWAHQPENDPELAGLTPGNLAYLIYTSGSTGLPKGVMVEHASVCQQVAALQATFGLGAADRCLQFASFTFDASVEEIFGALLSGAALVLRDDGWLEGADAFWSRCEANGVTVADLPTRFWQLLASEPAAAVPPCVRLVVIGGEAVEPGSLAAWFRRPGHLPRLLNTYGPTETTVNATVHEAGAESWRSIGRPMPGTRVYILDAHGQPVPVGVAGEIHVAGGQVARGYLNRPELTLERFVDDPFGGGRMYRTGDLGRWLPDGTIEFLGRNDFQVKIRGFRVELGEIEARLGEVAEVRQAVVLALAQGGDTRLVAYYAAAEALEVEMLRAHLAERLPDHMVPAAFVHLEAIPVTNNGKVNRKALPAPEGDAFATRGYEAPLGATEEALAAIWAEVLGVERVGRNDHFFEMGGHSLLAVRVISRVRQVLDVEVGLGDLFMRPVLAELARGLETAARAALPAIEPVERGGAMALSFAQQRLWFIEQLGSTGRAYHIPTRLRLHGELDTGALVRALDRIVARHEALRTTFVEVDGQPVQVIAPESRFHLVQHDLAGREDAEAELRRVLAEESATAFDLARGPLIRGRLVRLAADDHVLVVTMHHIVSDGWSMGVLSQELGTLYTAFLRGEADPLAPLPVQYADYAAWQRRRVDGDVLQQQADYWKTTLTGAPELLELPTDHARPLVQSHAGASLAVELDEELSAGLKALSQRHGTTLFMTLMAGWAAMLGRLSGQDDVVIGTPTANRGQREIEGLIGFFVNTLALRMDLSGSVAELLERVKARATEAQDRQDIPFEQVVELVQPARSMAHTPLVQVMFAWQNNARGSLELPGLRLAGVGAGEAAQVTAKFDLSLALSEVGSRIAGSVEYATSLFERETVERYLGYLRAVLAAMVADDSQAVDRLPLLPAEERVRVVETFNATATDFPRGSCIHELFEAHAERTPHALALGSDDCSLTYAELNARANQLARHLRGLGAGPDARVAICVERGPEMVVGMLAVLKAGGAYVPMDPAYPGERLRYMVEDSAPVVLLTQASLAGAFEGMDVPVLDLHAPVWTGEAEGDLERAGLTPEHLAYVIYTSGSTGQPKGVMVEHRNLANLVHWHCAEFGVVAGSRSSSIAGVAFDATAWEVWPPLCAGGALLLPGGARDPEALLEWWAGQELDVSFLPTPMAEFALARGVTNPRLRTLLTGGDRLRHAPDAELPFKLVNNYGPTEATVLATSGEVGDSARVHIGRPVANARVYILDANGQPVPVGVAGELFIGGAGVARGYLNRPEMTAERFVEDPFNGGRMYRTGDLGRWLADGNIEFLGRTDHQVKVRGFRIELGEIEAQLATHPALRDVVVAAREDVPGDTRLVAYYVGVDRVDAEALRAHLSGRVPAYMVPAAFVQMDRLPLTPNGKVNRKALPAPEGDAFATRGYEAPVGETEETLAGIWAGVLGVERVGRNDHFFEMGGHSLRAVQVVSRVRQALGVEVSLGDLFLRPVLADFALGLETGERTRVQAITPADRGGRLELSFAQQRLWFLERMGGAGRAYHIPARLRLQGELDRDALVRALDRIVARHEALRTAFVEVDGQPVQVIAPESRFHLVQHDLTGREDAEAELRRVLAEESGAAFDLEHGPLIRGRLVRMAADDHVLALTMHHIVSDGWSMGVLTRELSALYAAFRSGEADPLAPLPVQYADYAAWQRRRVDGEVLQEQADYWKTTLSGAPELLELPADRPRPPVQSHAGAFAALELDGELTAGLTALSKRHGTTLFSTLLAGWAATLGRLSGQDDVVIGTPTANRGQAEIEGLIGFFVNTLALRMDLSGSVAELLGHARARALEAQDRQDIPFEQVVDLVQPARSMAHTPIFQAMFSWQNTPQGRMELPGLTLGSVGANEAARVTAKFDISLSLQEAGGRIVGGVEYATSLFDAATAERYLGYLRSVLAAMVADDGQSVSHLPLLPAEERAQVLTAFNATAADFPREACIHELFRAHAQRTPAAVAVVSGDEELTYAELDARANGLAHHLRGLGIGAGDYVAILMQRSAELVVAELGVLKAGAAYVPIDPTFPAERVTFMVADSGSRVVLGRTGDELPALDVERVDVDALPASAEAVEVSLTSEAAAYVMYTSGSTGAPKGVVVPHRAVARLVVNGGYAEFGADSRVAFASNPAFDATTMEVWAPLLNGGRIVVIPQDVLLEPRRFGDALVSHGVNTLWMTVGLFNQYADELKNEIPLLRYLIVGGDALDPRIISRVLRGHAPRNLVNGYGPTETTTFAITHHITSVADGARSIPLGRPISNTQIYILDAQGQPVPVGVAGEIYIGGAGVALGYLNRPELTAERFVPDPFNGGRMYRTGDLGRWLADGTVEFLGRNDFQVKLRGFRIEMGEIEAQLATHPALREVVVTVREDAPGDKRLVAYYVGMDKVDADALRTHLTGRVPAYMVPAAFVALEQFPLTPNGKVNRKALPAPEGDAFATRGYEAPVGDTETALAEIWSEVLGVERVGRNDHFFELGGHSLRAVQVVARVRQMLGVEVALADVFTYPTLEALAGRMGGSLPELRGDRAIPVRTTGSQRPLFLVHEGTGSVAYTQALRPHIDADIPLYALPAVSVSELRLRTVEGMAARMVKMIREVQPEGPYRLAGWSFGGTVAYEIATQLIGQDQAVEFVGMMDTHYRAAETDGDDYGLLLRMLRMEEGLGEVGGAALAGLASAAATLDLEALVARCHETGLLPARVTADRVRGMRGRLRDHARAMREYFAQPIPAPVHIFPAQQGPAGDVRLGWQAVLGGTVRVTPVPGNHLSMMEATNAEALGKALSREIAHAAGSRKPVAEESYSPLITLQFGRAGAAPLFCVPGAGASVVSFTGLGGCVDPSWPVHGLQSRGMEGQMVPHSSVEAAAEAYLRVVEATQPEGPVHLLGHSFGGWIVFEMAQRLRRAGRVVGSLTIVDTRVPDGEGAHAEWESGEVFLQLVKIFEQTVERPLGIGPAEAAALDEAGRMKLLHARLVQAGLMPQRSTPDVLRGPFRTFATCMRTHYTPAEIYPDPVRLVLVPDPELGHEENRRTLADLVRGWRRWAPRLEFMEGAGNHMTALKAPHVAALAATLAADREAARRVYLPNLQLMGVEETSAAD